MRDHFTAYRKVWKYLLSIKLCNLTATLQRLQRFFFVFLLCYFCIVPEIALAEENTQSPVQTQPLITQEIRYHWSKAGEVILLWGVNDQWEILPEAQRPPDTVVKQKIMYTPMYPWMGYFSTKLQLPPGTKINYYFRIPITTKGEHIDLWDTNHNKGFKTVVKSGGVIDIKETIMRQPTYTLVFDIVFLLLLLGISWVLALPNRFETFIQQLTQKFQPQLESLKKLKLSKEQTILIGLISLMVLGLALRLWVAWQTNLRLPHTIARLMGDEGGYEALANQYLHGDFFPWPGRTPGYPLFIALCYRFFGRAPALVLYAQAFLGTTTIPLTFLLARRFTGPWLSLLAAGLIAIHPSLILHTTVLYAEILYIPLLLIWLLLLLKALDTAKTTSFTLLGGWMAVVNLCRPTMMLFTAAMPFLLPQGWKLKRKLSCFFAYLISLVLVTAPWTYHNYVTYHKFLPYSVSAAVLWFGSPEYYHLSRIPGGALYVWKNELNPDTNGGYSPFTIEGDRYFKKRGMSAIKAQPGVYAWFCLQKVVYFWLGSPKDWSHHTMYSVDGLRRLYSNHRIVGNFATRLMPLVALASMFIIRHRWREFWPFLVLLGYFTAIHSLTHAQIRFSEPLHPVLAVIIAVAVGEIVSRFRLHKTQGNLAE